MIKQSGFSLIAAIFILIIISLLGQYLVSITGVQRQTSLLALQTARAYQAANAGIEWGVAQVLNGSCIASTEISPALGNFVTTVDCIKEGDFDENGNIRMIYRLTSQSEFGAYGSVDYVSRRLQAIVHD